MSLDGYVVGPDDRVEALHGWYLNGEVETPSATEGESVVIASPNIAQQALQLGLLDETAISLVPVLLGDGILYFAKYDAAPIALTDPDVV